MSALFPNVPNLPGVPPVARAVGSLQSMLSKSNVAETGARSALSALVAGDTGSAIAGLGVAQISAGSAHDLGLPIFSTNSDPLTSLSGTIDNAASALTSIGLGNLGDAITSTQRSIDNAVRAVGSIGNALSPLVQTLLGGLGLQTNEGNSAVWGLYEQGGALALEPDNIVTFENTQETRISTFPIEKGGFGSYNKVTVPADITLVMTRGGSVEDRREFLKAALKVAASVELYNVVTPTAVYLDMNVTGLRQAAASDRGANLTTLELHLEEVRQTATLSFVNTTKTPTSAAPVNNGSVQTRPPPIAPELEGFPQ